MALPPCHVMSQFYIHNDEISCHMYQRSADMFLGVPFNIASYSLLVCIFSEILDLKPGDFIWTGGDCHLYLNHLEQARLQISREPLDLPKLVLDPTITEIDQFKYENISIEGYTHHPHISAPISI